MKTALLQAIVALCKRRGFVYPGSEIYGGFANTYSYGPYGAALKKNIADLWWHHFVRSRKDMLGLDGPILLNTQTWRTSGHESGFSDALVDCRSCKSRFRTDKLIENATGYDTEGFSMDEIDRVIKDKSIACPLCHTCQFTKARQFNLMFKTDLSKTSEITDIAYLRPETAQAIFLDFKNVLDTTRARLPFGLAQIGKAFRNEITPGNFLFRLIEFEQMEIEYFIKEDQWEQTFDLWLDSMRAWCSMIGLPGDSLKTREHPAEKLSHYSKKTVDIEFEFPFGWGELYGLAYRGDYDLRCHGKESGKSLDYTDPHTKEKFTPHVIEPTFGLDRTFLALLCSAYEEEALENGEMRHVLHLTPQLAPVKCAFFPLMNKPELLMLAERLYSECSASLDVELDQSGSIGKRYRRQDELGTPLCITVDYQSLEDGTVTIRDRDTMVQKRIFSKDVLFEIDKHLQLAL